MKKLFIALFLTFMAVFSLTACSAAAEMSYSGSTLTISGMEDTGLLIQASYDASGVLQTVKTHNVQNGNNTIPATKGDRLFLWKDLKSAQPLCETMTVNEEGTAMTDEQTAVLAAYNTIQQAMVDADLDTLRRVIKDDKTFTHMSGKVQTKEEYLSDIASGALNYQSYTIENPSVEIDGSHAKLTAVTTLTANAYGAQGSWPFNTTAWFENIGGEWIYCNEPTSTEPVSEKKTGEFDLEKGIVKLNSGYDMPILGIGTYQLSNSQAENSVYWALRDGYRLIDTARIYGNEEGVGRGIKKAIEEGFVTREEIFVTTKMWTSDFNNGAAAIEGSLSRLGLDYIDLMILHHSQPSNDVTAYKAMETAVGEGKLRSIGLSNYYTPSDFDRLVNATTITPALLQNETHPYHQSKEMKEHLKQYDTVMESWFPLGGRGNTTTLFNDATISSIAAAHNKTSAQVILRWHLQAGNIAIPGSSNEAHIQENYEIFDFELSDDEMQRLTDIDKNTRFASY